VFVLSFSKQESKHHRLVVLVLAELGLLSLLAAFVHFLGLSFGLQEL
jgi:hypothetical protein